MPGGKDLVGETVLEGPGAVRIRRAESGGRRAETSVTGERRVITCSHGEGEELQLRIIMG